MDNERAEETPEFNDCEGCDFAGTGFCAEIQGGSCRAFEGVRDERDRGYFCMKRFVLWLMVFCFSIWLWIEVIAALCRTIK